jgi:NADH-quinone oxidoreductase subunit M
MSDPAALLTAVVFLPSLGALVLTLFPSDDHTNLKATAIGISLVDFALALLLWTGFDPSRSGYQFAADLPWISQLGIGYRIGIDGISLVLILLTAFIMPITLVGAWSSITTRVKEFGVAMLVLQTGMLGAFVALDLFLFYVFWEAMLVPMYFLIGVWGGQRRVYAAVKFFIFTMAGSLLMLLAIIYVASQTGGGWSFGLEDALARTFSSTEQQWLFWAFAIAFAIKVPMVPVHTWLPDAHVEAPTPGSVVLAGVLLKLGVYGFLRFAFPLFPEAATGALPILGWLGVIGIIHGALVAWVQPDMKKLVAYSSVSHLGFCMLGLAALTDEAVSGAVFIMVAHGVSTPALFLLVGVLYEQRHTRKLSDYGGIAKRMPVFAFFLVVAALASAGLPALSGFPGEFLVLLGTFTAGAREQVWGVVAATGVILAAIYLLWMVQKVLFGPLHNPANESLRDMSLRETSLLGTLMAFALVLGLYPNLVLDPLEPAVAGLVRNVHARGARQAYRPDYGVYRSVGLRLLDPDALRRRLRPRLVPSPRLDIAPAIPEPSPRGTAP